MRHTHIFAGKRILPALLALPLASLLISAAPGTRLSGGEDVWSFDMWCLDMKLYSADRCNARQPDDVKDYERYRAAVEQYQAQRAARERRDQDIQNRLNRDPGTIGR